ncbi:MAG: hypothetical protein KAS64_09705, partial [Spirochaetes bacterium]|nr:hypothetical protein [Spirochaetota bacterium]
HFNKLITSAKMFIKRVGAGKPFIIKDPIWPHKRGTLARLVVNPFLASNIFKNIGLENIPILPYLQLEDHTIIDSYGSIGLGIIGSLGSSTDFFLKTAGNYLAGDGEDKIFFLNSGIKWQFFNSGDNLFALTFAPLFQYRFDQHANQRFTQFSAQIAGSFHITSRLLIDGAYQQPIIRSYMGFGREDEEYFPKGINYIGITYDFSASGRYKISLRFERERIIAIYSMDYIKYGYDFTDKRFLWYLLDVNF